MVKETNKRINITVDLEIWEQYLYVCSLKQINKNKLIELFIKKVVTDYENNYRMLN